MQDFDPQAFLIGSAFTTRECRPLSETLENQNLASLCHLELPSLGLCYQISDSEATSSRFQMPNLG